CGSDSIGWSSPRNQSLLPNAVTRRGAVSPATRAIPRSPPVTNALLADGTTTRRMVRYRGMPKARDDSLTAMGTRRKAYSEGRATNGTMMVDSARTPEIVQIGRAHVLTPVTPNSRTRE